MKIYWSDNLSITPEQVKLIEQALQSVVSHEGAPADKEVSISLQPPDGMAMLNRTYRGIDSETDVLSFSGIGDSYGDIIICPEIARIQAVEYGHSLDRELTFLAVHGMLHLLGHDHMNPDDEARMIAAQESILNQLGVSR